MKFKRRLKYYLVRLFRVKGSAHQLAAGVTIGFVPSWLPTFGLGPALSVALAKLIKANTFAAFIGGLVGTLIWPLLFLLNYKVGALILDRRPKIDGIEEIDYIEALNHTVDGLDSVRSGGYMFVVGGLSNIFISSVMLYIFSYFLFKKYRVNILNKLRSKSGWIGAVL